MYSDKPNRLLKKEPEAVPGNRTGLQTAKRPKRWLRNRAEARKPLLRNLLLAGCMLVSACQNVGFVEKAKAAATGDLGIEAFVTGAGGIGSFLSAASGFDATCNTLQGIQRANCYCQSEATGRQFSGTYRAWLSISGSVDAICNIQGNEGTGCTVSDSFGPFLVKQTSGMVVLAEKYSELATSGVRSAIDTTGAGPNLIWTGSFANGRASGTDCSGWTDGAAGNGTAGDRTKTGTDFSSSASVSCVSSGALLCMKVGK